TPLPRHLRREQTRARRLYRDARSRSQTIWHRAVLIEPVFTKTNVSRNEKSTLTSLDAYADQRKRVEEVVQQRIAQGDEPRAVAEIIYLALTTASPRLHYPVGEGIMLSRLRRFLPPRL